MKKILLILVVVLAFCLKIKSDGEQSQGTVDKESLLPKSYKAIEPSMASLGKYGAYSVNLFNGLPNISFTLYNIQSGNLNIPIVLSYHGGGIKVAEEASWVGLGWSLSYGGVITRSVSGLPDEKEDFSQVPNQSSINDYMLAHNNDYDDTFISGLGDNTETYMQDKYNFNIPGNSGSFVLDENKEPVLIPYAPLKIDFIGTDKHIQTSDGTKYYFKGCDETEIRGQVAHKSSWSVEKITSIDGKDVINYSYQNDGSMRSVGLKKYEGYSINGDNVLTPIQLTSSNTYMTVSALKPHIITYNGGKIEFVISDRSDIFSYESSPTINRALKKLDEIRIYKKDKIGEYVHEKTIKFNYSYFGGDENSSYSQIRLRLDEVIESVVEDKIIGEFKYYEGLPSKTSYSTDYWGYYNGENNSSPIPKIIVNNTTIGGAVKASSNEHMKAGSLKEIIYPTGGRTQFYWEANDFYLDNLVSTPKVGTKSTTISVYANEINGYDNAEHPTDGIQDPGYDGYISKTVTIQKNQNVNVNYKLHLYSSTSSHSKYDSGELKIYDETESSTVFSTNSEIYSTAQTQQVSLKAGHTYKISVKANCNNVNAQIWFSYLYDYTYNEITGMRDNYIVGGLRIDSIVNYNVNSQVTSIKSYRYKMPNDASKSSGFCKTDLSDIDYVSTRKSWYSDNGSGILECISKVSTTTLYHSDAVTGIYSTPVCYQYVQEFAKTLDGDDNGYILYKYSVEKDQSYTKDILVSNDWKRGQLLNKKEFKKQGEIYTLISEEKNTYSIHAGSSKSIKGFKMYKHYENEPTCGLDNTINFLLTDKYEPINYFYETGWYHLDRKELKKYYDGKAVDNTSNYYYNTTNHLKPYYTTLSATNKTVHVYYTYLSNDIALPKTRRKLIGGTEVINEVLDYNSFNQPYKFTSRINDEIIKQVELKYDNKILVQEKVNDNIPKAYVWDSKNINVLAIIEGVEYSSISTTLISKILGLEEETNHLNILNINKSIRNNLPSDCIVYTYTYSPVLGMTSQTDPNGKTTFYEYDALGRLRSIKDSDLKVIKEVKYKYATEQ